MKTINKRTILLIVATGIFSAVCVMLMISMFSNAEEYALNSVNSHLYSNGVLINAGSIVDKNNVVLAESVDGEREYNDDADIRAALLHIIGDDEGFIAGGVQNNFKEELIGYSLFYGVNKESKSTLYLTLDAQLCAYAYNQLGSYKGCIAVANYKTGELVCIATTPTYDIYNKPDIDEDSDEYEGIYINRFFGGLYTPGSIFKTVTALAAVENIDDIFSRTYYCSGSCDIGSGTIVCSDVHGTVTFQEALNQSCNVAFAQIAVELGAETLSETFDSVGLSTSYSTIDRITTYAGSFGVDSDSSDSEVGWAGIGQSATLVNPYSFLTYMCAIANGGTAYTPYFVKSAVNGSGRTVYYADPDDSGISISSSTASTLKELLRSDVSDYYGDYMFGDVTMCGKTGTAERDEGNSHAWFAGFSYDESFPYAIVVIVEDSGSGLKYAGYRAANVMQELYDSLNS